MMGSSTSQVREKGPDTGAKRRWRGIWFGLLAFALVACQSETIPTTTTAGATTTSSLASGETTTTAAPPVEHGFRNGDTLTLITGTNPGGGFDITLRILQPILEEKLLEVTGLNIRAVVENIPGAGQQIGYESMSRAEPDGLTIAYVTLKLAAAHQVFRDAFDMREWTHLGQISDIASTVVIRRDLELSERSFAGLIERSQELPILWGNAGTHTDFLLMVELLREAGVELAADEVILEGTADQVAALLRGDLEAAWLNPAAAAQFVGEYPDVLEELVTTGCERDPIATEVPSITEEDIPGVDEVCRLAGGGARSMAGPAGIPDGTAFVLREAIRLATEDPRFVSQMTEQGYLVIYFDHTHQEEASRGLIEVYTQYIDLLRD